jgi:hypothetical protein
MILILSGYVTTRQSREILDASNDPTAAHPDRPAGPFHCNVQGVALSKLVLIRHGCIFGTSGIEQRRLKFFRMVGREPQRRGKYTGFVPTARMLGVQAVIAQFSDFNHGVLDIR